MTIYFFDPLTHRLLGCRKEASDYELKSNETDISIPIGIKNVHFEDGTWIGEPIDSDLSKKMISKLGIDMVQTQQMIAKLATLIVPKEKQNNE